MQPPWKTLRLRLDGCKILRHRAGALPADALSPRAKANPFDHSVGNAPLLLESYGGRQRVAGREAATQEGAARRALRLRSRSSRGATMTLLKFPRRRSPSHLMTPRIRGEREPEPGTAMENFLRARYQLEGEIGAAAMHTIIRSLLIEIEATVLSEGKGNHE